jgi:imidazole glycerol-phosphate synthase subunit HisH
MIGIVNYNMGNLASVSNAFTKLDIKTNIESNPDNIQKYDKLLLPGVGAFGDAMTHLKSNGMDQAIKDFASSGKPLLGICLGMQLLFQTSKEFGSHDGLGLIEGEIIKFDETRFDHHLKIPHMGWNEMFVQKNTPIFDGLPKDFYLYFVHSYHAICDDKYAIGKTHYGYEFVSSVQKDNIFGIQPHPEKSHANGLKILENFAKL